ncbi:MAG: pyridoxal phosphate-dependent aminotransferase, partial [Candidatus Acidiferrales bacterium]
MFAERTNWNFEPNRLSEALARHRAAGKALLDLTASNPTECGFEYPGGAILEALGNPAALTYSSDARGLRSARESVAGYYAARGVAVPVDEIILTTSTSEAYSFAFRTLCNPGDEILVPEPSYPLFAFLADIQDVRLVRYPLVYDHAWQIDFHALEGGITKRTRAVIVVHPNNPTGHFVKAREMEALNRLCAERDLAIIADEVFLDFALTDEARFSFAGNAGALTFTTSGLSKISGLPQMKAAWLITGGPEHLKAAALARLEVIADTYLSMNAPVQAAMPALFEQRHGFQKQVLARVMKNLVELDRQLALQKACSRLVVEGGWYVVLRVPATRPDEEFAIELLEGRGVYVHPGHFYDFGGDGYLVLSLITREEEFREGVAAMLS